MTLRQSLLAVLLCASSATSFAQDGAALLASYKSAIVAYDQGRVDAVRARAVVELQHPARAFWPRFEAAAASGADAVALGWLAQHAYVALDPSKERIGKVRGAIELLHARHRTSRELHDALGGLITCRADAEEAPSLRLCEEVAGSDAPEETRARAWMVAAHVISDNLRSADAARLDQAEELQRSVVLSFPKTKAAKEASGLWMPRLEREFLRASLAWQDEVQALRASGRRFDQWPPHPIHRYVAEFRLLAATGHSTAMRMCEVVHPAIDQAFRTSPGIGLSFLYAQLLLHYPPRAEGWAELRPRILELALREFPNERWAIDAFVATRREVELMPPRAADGACRAALELCDEPRVRALAWWCLARTHLVHGDDASLGVAHDSLVALIDEHPDEEPRLLEAAAIDKARIAALRVGQPLPDFRGEDAEGQPVILRGYKGRVMLLVYWSRLQRETLEALPDWVRLRGQLGGRPFEVVGVCPDQVSRHSEVEERRKLGVAWRSIMTLGRKEGVMDDSLALRLPLVVVVDDLGVIRGRNLPFAETKALVERLLLECEARSKR
ncbi:MAG: redoxin domain-containing protein [Planctomycetia bacterium]